MSTGGGKSKAKSESEMPQDLVNIIKEFWTETGALRSTMQSQMLEALQTGGIGAHLPIIQQAEQAQRTATATSLRDLDTQLAQSGLTGTPFGERIRSEAALTGRSQLAAIGPNYASQLISGIPGYVQGAAQSIFGALPGTRTADSSSKASQASGSCCFIFICGHGYLHPTVRRYRDLKTTVRNRRGYYWLSDRLVPLMQQHAWLKRLIRLIMIDPMVSYGKHYFHEGGSGIYAPITSFWLMLFHLLGFRAPYTRRGTTEVV